MQYQEARNQGSPQVVPFRGSWVKVTMPLLLSCNSRRDTIALFQVLEYSRLNGFPSLNRFEALTGFGRGKVVRLTKLWKGEIQALYCIDQVDQVEEKRTPKRTPPEPKPVKVSKPTLVQKRTPPIKKRTLKSRDKTPYSPPAREGLAAANEAPVSLDLAKREKEAHKLGESLGLFKGIDSRGLDIAIKRGVGLRRGAISSPELWGVIEGSYRAYQRALGRIVEPLSWGVAVGISVHGEQ